MSSITEDLIYEDIVVKESDGVRFKVKKEGAYKYIDIFSDERYKYMCLKSPYDYLRDVILSRKNEDIFPDVVGKHREKELLKIAILSNSRILFIGEKGFGKTTFAKSVHKLLPKRILAIKGCKIFDNPLRPVDYACKYKVLQALEGKGEIEVVEVPPPFVRIPGDPHLTSRQLIGGISIQKIREGYDLDSPEVFLPGRALKANRGLLYIDELGAIPSVLQTLLHELLEEGQITTTEGDIVPFRIDTIVIASTNPENYRGINPIKEPLLDRMEKIEIGPPETLEYEVEIGIRNMYIVKERGERPNIPAWVLEFGARLIRYLREESLEVKPSCRATIKLFDHMKSYALTHGKNSPRISELNKVIEAMKLAILGRIRSVDRTRKSIEQLLDSAIKKAKSDMCRVAFELIPADKFDEFYQELRRFNGGELDVNDLRVISRPLVFSVINKFLQYGRKYQAVDDNFLRDEYYYSMAYELLLEALSECLPNCVKKENGKYILHELKECEKLAREEKISSEQELDILDGTEMWPPVPH